MGVDWEILNGGRQWQSSEAMDRYFMAPEKIEMVDGKLFNTAEERETLLCLLLENVGANRAVNVRRSRNLASSGREARETASELS